MAKAEVAESTSADYEKVLDALAFTFPGLGSDVL